MPDELNRVVDETAALLDRAIDGFAGGPVTEEVGRVVSLQQGIVRAEGLSGVKSEELVEVGRDGLGMALDLLPEAVGIVLLTPAAGIRCGDEIRRTGRVVDVPVGEALLGRIVDPLGRPLDNGGPVATERREPAQREAPPIIDRAPVETPMQTGIAAIDALIPIGRGQRELILGDRQTGKTGIAVDAIINQRDKGIPCVYCAIGQRSSSVAKVVAELRRHQALAYTVIVVAEGNDPPGLQFLAPYAATTMAEFFMARGSDVLIVYDDLTRHAQSYRQISLLLRRPPGREAFPGDIFYIHSRLLERATRLHPEAGGGSITALPVIETEAQNLSAYIPTNLISITDGQIYLSPELFQKGMMPAVEIAKSVSRVGGKAQLAAYRKVAGALRLAYAQFQELEIFSRFGTRLDAKTKAAIEHGRRVREVLKQEQFRPLAVGEQIAMLLAVNEGFCDGVALAEMRAARAAVANLVAVTPGLEGEIRAATADAPVWARLTELLGRCLAELQGGGDADAGRAAETDPHRQ